uniref:Glycoside hydrolase family 28 n=1 Tax=Extatosoma tiaratum TaxID=7024 RepID=A0A191XSY6_EXTTI|nr:glycoside hydrolase family 28 [Extatosoma tiaratum]
MQQPHTCGFVAVLAILAMIHVGSARDLRNVTEPKNPEVCTRLKASGGDDSEAIQKALNSCDKGKAVALVEGTFYSGPLDIPSGVSILVEEDVILKALTDPKLYDVGANTCGTLNEFGVGCKAFINMYQAHGSGIYGKGTIDGQGNVTMTGKNESWYQLAHDALLGGTYQNNPPLIQINNSVDITLYQITLLNSAYFTVRVYETNGLTVWGLTILAPYYARNTDGVGPVGCQNVTIVHNFISIGDDNVAVKALTAPSRYISIYNNHFETGNGMSIGSEVNYGASHVTVANLTLNGSTNGVHVKSNMFRGGHITRASFTNICIINVQKPIHVDMEYMNLTGSRIPEFHDITFNNIKVLTKGRFIFHGLSESNPAWVRLRDVHIKNGSVWLTSNARITGAPMLDATGDLCGYQGNS